MQRELKPGYHIFYAMGKGEGGPERIAVALEEQINEAEKDWDIEFYTTKIDADSGGHNREMYFGYQVTVLRAKSVAKSVSKGLFIKEGATTI